MSRVEELEAKVTALEALVESLLGRIESMEDTPVVEPQPTAGEVPVRPTGLTAEPRQGGAYIDLEWDRPPKGVTEVLLSSRGPRQDFTLLNRMPGSAYATSKPHPGGWTVYQVVFVNEHGPSAPARVTVK